MHGANSLRHPLTALLIFATAALLYQSSHAAPEPDQPVNPLPRLMEQTWQEEHFILGKIASAVRSVENDRGSITNNITFKIKVIFDNTSAPTNSEIAITGPESGMNATGAGSWEMPNLTIGDASVFRVKSACDPNWRQGRIELPIGLVTGSRVDPRDIEEVKEALTLASKYLPVKDPKKIHDDATFLFKSKRYYLWALGAFLLGIEGGNDNQNLMGAYAVSEKCDMDRFLWLSEQLPDQRPVQLFPIYRYFMQKHSYHRLEPAGSDFR